MLEVLERDSEEMAQGRIADILFRYQLSQESCTSRRQEFLAVPRQGKAWRLAASACEAAVEEYRAILWEIIESFLGWEREIR